MGKGQTLCQKRKIGRYFTVSHQTLKAFLYILLALYKRKRPSPGPSRKLEVETVRAVLIQSGGNKAKAARLLSVGRATLYRFLADFPGVS